MQSRAADPPSKFVSAVSLSASRCGSSSTSSSLLSQFAGKSLRSISAGRKLYLRLAELQEGTSNHQRMMSRTQPEKQMVPSFETRQEDPSCHLTARTSIKRVFLQRLQFHVTSIVCVIMSSVNELLLNIVSPTSEVEIRERYQALCANSTRYQALCENLTFCPACS